MDCIELQPLSAITSQDDLTPHPRINLSSSEDIRREMARIYRETRSRNLAPNDATKLIYMLTQILKAHEVYFMEEKLLDLESRFSKNAL
jgi:hypothetical protein